eukprot:TRINITY_DN26121_c0_g1_i3.p1 TRINITY_DN26121_c0_g1~~TRINITY_DN26121_c0_g1_i3.p1  ORF type:complete len:450 (+),score=137.17 TRINITY_DN26121_c0_g1_i3:90-1352(+)
MPGERGCLRRSAAMLCRRPQVTPWEVADAPIRYDRVVRDFGCEHITPGQLERLAASGGGGAPHTFFRRNIAFAHRDLDKVLEEHAGGRSFYLYTGRGPSDSAMHLGHALPFLLTRWLQRRFGVPLVIQITDDEKFLFRDIEMSRLRRMAIENIKDILSFGFDPEQTFVFMNLDYVKRLYPNALSIQRHVTFSQVRGVFGFDESSNIGKVAFPAMQAAPCISSTFPVVLPVKSKMRCLIPCAIDQDPFFRVTRDVCPKLKCPKPSLIYTKFLPPLTGVAGKMSSSAPGHATIHLGDDPDTVKKKLRRAFSGGAATMAEFAERGGDVDTDVAYQYMRHFGEDDEEVEDTGRRYRRGEVSSAAVKDRAAELVSALLGELAERRAGLSDADVERVMQERPLKLRREPQAGAAAPQPGGVPSVQQ